MLKRQTQHIRITQHKQPTFFSVAHINKLFLEHTKMNSEVSYETVTFFILAVIQTWMILKEHSADLTLHSCNIIVQCPKTIIKIDPA